MSMCNRSSRKAVTYGKSLPALAGGHQAWRYTVMSGVIPAIPLILIRPFLPESPAWLEKKAALLAYVLQTAAATLRHGQPAPDEALLVREYPVMGGMYEEEGERAAEPGAELPERVA